MLATILAAEAELWSMAIDLGKLLICVAVVAGTIEVLARVWEVIDAVADDEYGR